MKRKTFGTIAVLLILLVSMYGTVFAQDGGDPTETVTPSTEPTDETTTPTAEPADTAVPGSKFFKHPVVQVLSLYFDRETDATPEDPNAPTPEPGEESDSGLGPIGEQIAALHEEGMGFGVLVKIFAIAEAQKAACPDVPPADDGTTGEPTCTALSAEDLVTAFQSGGMGSLFKQYGKPALLGVGHVKKALKNQPMPEPETTLEAYGNGKPPKTHPNNGNGNSNGKGKNK